MKELRYRMIFIVVLLVLSILQLLPRNVTQRVPDAQTGGMKDTSVRRVPINLGLDLQGGIHLALEVDQSKGPVADCGDAIRRAETVVRRRVDEFGTTEPVVQVIALPPRTVKTAAFFRSTWAQAGAVPPSSATTPNKDAERYFWHLFIAGTPSVQLCFLPSQACTEFTPTCLLSL